MRVTRERSWWSCVVLAAGLGAAIGLGTVWPILVALVVALVVGS